MGDPADAPRDPGCAPQVGAGLDSDRDGRPDSVFTTDGDDLLLHTDMDADGLADRSLRLHPDGTITEHECADPPSIVETVLRWLRIR